MILIALKYRLHYFINYCYNYKLLPNGYTDRILLVITIDKTSGNVPLRLHLVQERFSTDITRLEAIVKHRGSGEREHSCRETKAWACHQPSNLSSTSPIPRLPLRNYPLFISCGLRILIFFTSTSTHFRNGSHNRYRRRRAQEHRLAARAAHRRAGEQAVRPWRECFVDVARERQDDPDGTAGCW
jgi:hypothetical protein